MDVGITSVIGHMLIFQTRPGRAGDNLARLSLDIAEADFLFLFILRQMRVVATGKFTQGRATWPLVSGARVRIISAASIAVFSIGWPLAGPSALV